MGAECDRAYQSSVGEIKNEISRRLHNENSDVDWMVLLCPRLMFIN